MAIENFLPHAIDFTINEMMKALQKTKEFNYSLYAERLFTALNYNSKEIILIAPNENNKTALINIDLTPLGEINMWGEAIEAVRTAHGWNKETNESNPAARRSHMWMEKIYKPGREGSTVSNSSGENVSGNYSELYEQTIAERLSLIPEQYAPFWYIIEHGNATGIENFPDHEGTAYPIVEPTRMTDQISKRLKTEIDDLIRGYTNDADKLYSSLLDADFGVTGVTKTVESFIPSITEYLTRLVEQGILPKEKVANKTITQIEFDNKRYNLYISTRGRVAARFAGRIR